MIHSRPSEPARQNFPLTQATAVSATPCHLPLALEELDPRPLETFLLLIYFLKSLVKKKSHQLKFF